MKSADIDTAYDVLAEALEGVVVEDLSHVADLASALGKGGDMLDGTLRIVRSLELLFETVASTTGDRGAVRLAGAMIAARLELEK